VRHYVATCLARRTSDTKHLGRDIGERRIKGLIRDYTIRDQACDARISSAHSSTMMPGQLTPGTRFPHPTAPTPPFFPAIKRRSPALAEGSVGFAPAGRLMGASAHSRAVAAGHGNPFAAKPARRYCGRPLAFAAVLVFLKRQHFIRCAASRRRPPARLINPATARTRFSSTAILTNLALLSAIKRRLSA
jgi:hypothetical protein